MHTVQTEALPPNQGRICLAMIGCTRNSRKALANTVAAKRNMFCGGLEKREKGVNLYGQRFFVHVGSLLAQFQDAVLPVTLGAEPRECGRKGRVLPAPREPRGIVN